MEPGQSRKRPLRIIARLKARHPDPIRQMLVAAQARDRDHDGCLITAGAARAVK